MIHCHHLHDLAEAVNSHILFQFLTVLGRIMYTAGLLSLTLKQCIPFAGSETASSLQTGATGVENNIKWYVFESTRPHPDGHSSN